MRFESKLAGLAGRSVLLVVLASLAGTAWAVQPKEPLTNLDHKAFFRPELYLSSSNMPLEEALPRLPNRKAWEGFLAGQGRNGHVFIDPRSGAVTNVIGAYPIIPGEGVGNRLQLADLSRQLGRKVAAVDEVVVGDLVLRLVQRWQGVLGVEAGQLGKPRVAKIHDDLWHVTVPQQVGGVRVRDSLLVATINSGNLILLGTSTWGNARVSATPAIDGAAAMAAGFDYAEGRSVSDVVEREPRLEIVPFAPPQHNSGDAFVGPIGAGYGHRLVWTFAFRRPPEDAVWEVMVDAHAGEVIAFQDINHYVQRQVRGGVYPVTNTEICPTPGTCGTMFGGWPMPFANTGLPAPNNFTNAAGIYDDAAGTATTTLVGRYVRINDTCGAISLTASPDMDMGGTNGQHNCTTPGFGGAGNTASSRSAFYEVNKLAEQARGWLPNNTWLQSTLQTNVNINAACNAFYSFAGTINFYRSGTSGTSNCRNTGELASVFDHEWGHALDDNDSGGVLSSTSEAYADIASIYRLQDACVGHGFYISNSHGCGNTSDGTGMNCNMAQLGGTHCSLDCSGVRDTDWGRHVDNTPDTPQNFTCPRCSSSSGPCGRQVHCSSAPITQAAWDFVARDLRTAPFNYTSEFAFGIGNKLFYQGSGAVALWHACSCTGGTSDGCGATNGYMQWLGADDDNGSLLDGTPHMTALFAAYNRHNIACATPAPVNSVCTLSPLVAPAVTATPGNFQVTLSWNDVPGAPPEGWVYAVFRTEGHAGCNWGKSLIAYVGGPGASFNYVDTQVANGRVYSYNVVAARRTNSFKCFSPPSTCVAATPGPPPVASR